MGSKAEYHDNLREFEKMRQEDKKFDWRFDKRFYNFPESRNQHHVPVGMWAGEEQRQFGTHRRGPLKDE